MKKRLHIPPLTQMDKLCLVAIAGVLIATTLVYELTDGTALRQAQREDKPQPTAEEQGHAAAPGSGCHAEVHGECAIASAFGSNGRTMGGKIGDLLTLYQWETVDGKLTPISGITVRVDGEKIKPNVWYKLDGTEFVEADD